MGNIVQHGQEIDCTDIAGAQPLRFVGLYEHNTIIISNQPASVASTLLNQSIDMNYIPNLITVVGRSLFYFTSQFTIEESFPITMLKMYKYI